MTMQYDKISELILDSVILYLVPHLLNVVRDGTQSVDSFSLKLFVERHLVARVMTANAQHIVMNPVLDCLDYPVYRWLFNFLKYVENS